MTTDADLALDTSGLADSPEISATMRAAGFKAGRNPGSWLADGDIAVDIMVVPHQAGTTSKTARAGRIPNHDRETSRITSGLEPALVDKSWHMIGAMDEKDSRKISVQVAGPAALLIAKAIKIEERLADAANGREARLKEKDALDMFRLLQAVETEDLVDGIHRHVADDHARPVTERGLRVIRDHGTDPRFDLPKLASLAAAGDATVAPSFAALASDLIRTLGLNWHH
ncbi:hypothetical protein [Alloactinosynnema sp. L-07]|uniref:hypothetical protein n=1 Tax=Alloactinosynnema sp. L-07 TaxID=1653480 RepID=UPI00065F0702|nr:hypothetical protein [Alloactinosynnema sp. L-07]CRK61631.1 hypothetical protein [Alloactinosynnema sp. L-07]